MADFASLTVQLELQQAAFAKGMADAAKKIDQVGASAKKTQSAMAGLQQGFAAIKTATAAVGTAMAAIKGAEGIIKAADNIKTLEASFKALTGSAERGTDLLARTVQVADRAGAPLEDTASAIQRLTIALSGMGASNKQIADIAENFLKLGTIGGTSAAEAGRALTQFSQGLSAGALQGDELKAILEGMPLVAQAIAKEFGVATGELKKMGSEGQLTSARVGNAILKMTAEIDKQFAGMPVTLDQSLNRLETRWTLFLAAFDKASNLGNNVRTVIDFVADGIKRWTTELEGADGKMTAIGLAAKGLDVSFRVVAGAAAILAAQIELSVRATATLVLLAADVTTGFSNAGKIMADFGQQTAKAAADLIALEKRLMGLGKTAEEAARATADPLKGGGAKGGDAADKAKKEADALQKRADAIAASVNPLFAYNQALAEYTMLLEKGFLSESNFALAKEKATQALNAAGDAVRAATDPLFVYNQELEKLQRLYDAAAISAETLAKAQEQAKEKFDESQGKKKDKEKTFMEQMEDLAESAGAAMGEFFADIISGSATAEQAFEKMAKSILSKIAEMVAAAVAAQIIKMLLGGGGGGDIAGGSGTIMSAPAAAMSAATSALMSGAAATGAAVASFARGPAAPTLTASDATMSPTAGTPSNRPELNVVVNNNAGDAVSTRMNESGDLEITIDRVRRALSRDMSRGGNLFSDTLQQSFGLNRSGAT